MAYMGNQKEVIEQIKKQRFNNEDFILIPTSWCVGDVIEEIGELYDESLSDYFFNKTPFEQNKIAIEILKQIGEHFDAYIGVNWDVIKENCSSYLRKLIEKEKSK